MTQVPVAKWLANKFPWSFVSTEEKDVAKRNTLYDKYGGYWPSWGRNYSVDPAIVDVQGNLCARCRGFLSKSRWLRLELVEFKLRALIAAAEQGCYICALSYETPYNLRSITLPTDDMIHINTADQSVPDKYSREIETYTMWNGVFTYLEIVGNKDRYTDPDYGDIVEAKLLLVPEAEIDDAELKDIAPNLTPEHVTELTQVWLNHCQENHPMCHSDTSPFLPARLVYVGKDGELPRVTSSIDIPAGLALKYTTLSHCWGTTDFLKLSSSNLEAMTTSLPMDKLTEVFQDAIDLTRNIGIHYIWIDSLCIIQDSHEDWTHESELMGEVYKHSWLNIAATGFKDGHSGLYTGARRLMRQPQKIVVQHYSREDRSVYCVEDIWRNEVTNAPLNTRGWVFQERALSPRVLNFSSRQVFWECREHEACESFPKGLPPSLRDGFKNRISIDVASESNQTHLLTWTEIVENYNRTRFTHADDKLVALAGIVRELKPFLGDEFVAGMWMDNLLPQLLWRSGPGGFYRQRAKRPEIAQGPSWSWASIDGSVYNNAIIHLDSFEPLAHLDNVEITRDDKLIFDFGRVISANLIITGHLTRTTLNATYSEKAWRGVMTVWTHNEYRVQLESVHGPKSPTIVKVLLEADVYKVVPSKIIGRPKYPFHLAVGDKFYMFTISQRGELEIEGLILLPTGQKGTYKRVGAWTSVDETTKAQQLNHKPLLEEEEYLKQESVGRTTIRII